jgi:hypothetical protein
MRSVFLIFYECSCLFVFFFVIGVSKDFLTNIVTRGLDRAVSSLVLQPGTGLDRLNYISPLVPI